MHPVLFDFGIYDLPFLGSTHLFLPTYGFLFATGALAAWWWFTRRALGLGIAEEKVFNLGFYALLSGILGAKITLLVVDTHGGLPDLAEILSTVRSAGVLLGGVLFGSIAFALYCRHHDLPLLRLGDAAAAPLALAQAVGRLGCFSAGCCYGVPGRLLGVTFTDPVAQAQTGVTLGVPLVPTQLIQMGSDLLLAGALTWLWRRRIRPDGSVFWWYLLLYGVSRGIIENYRGDTVRGTYSYFGIGVSTSQLLAAAGITLALVMLVRGVVRRRAAAAS